MRRFAFVCLGVALLATAARADAPRGARGRGARLAWARGAGAEACVGPLGLEESVRALLGANPFAAPTEITVEGAAFREGAGLRVDLVVRDTSDHEVGRRTLRSAALDCRELGRATATVVAVLIDPDLDPTTPPPVDDGPADARDAAPPSAPARPAPERAHLRATLAGGVTAGLVPGPSDVWALRAELPVGPRFAVGLGASWFRPIRQGDFAFGVTAAEARACATPLGPPGLLGVCAAALVGVFDASLRATRLRPVEVGPYPWAGVELGPRLALPLGGALALHASLSAIVPLVRRQGFVGAATEPVWEQSPIGGRAELGLVLRP